MNLEQFPILATNLVFDRTDRDGKFKAGDINAYAVKKAEKGLALLSSAVGAGEISPADFKDLKSYVNGALETAWKAAVQKLYLIRAGEGGEVN